MIQMRENRYDDIRKGTVDRTGDKAEPKSPVKLEAKSPETKSKDEAPKEKGENLDEYNSWS
jgi:hypothetical protein